MSSGSAGDQDTGGAGYIVSDSFTRFFWFNIYTNKQVHTFSRDKSITITLRMRTKKNHKWILLNYNLQTIVDWKKISRHLSFFLPKFQKMLRKLVK